MLCSSVIKERLYIGEATVATLCGIIFGPHAAGAIDPQSWGSLDIVTIEFSRIVLVVQCFAIGVELPKFYMEKHWKSVVLLLIPVMIWGWLITSVIVMWMVPSLNFVESLVVAACVTPTDPILASSVVGKGKFAKRVPKHLRDLLSAESGCNDGMAFPFVYLALYLIQDKQSAKDVSFHWVVYTILYECLFGAIYGFMVGYIARHGIRYAHKHELVDRESFLVFYFVLALFCAGSGSLLGMDDLLVGFAAGVGFSNDGWFGEKTEESHVSNVIDLLLNLTYFVFLGTIIPWSQFNDAFIGLSAWRLSVIAILILLFRRIPIMLALKPLIPDIKTWREALFTGHFGPIGVGAIFIAMLARAELESETVVPLAELPPVGSEHYTVILLIWPIVTFIVIASILIHGSSIAVFTLGKHINTLSLTMSYTTGVDDGPSWMNRLPRISSQSRSQARTMSDTEIDEIKMPEFPPGTLPPTGVPGQWLRRVKEEENGNGKSSRASSLGARRRKKKWDDGIGPGGPISQSAIYPQRQSNSDHTSATLQGDSPNQTPPEQREPGPSRSNGKDPEKDDDISPARGRSRSPPLEVFREGDDIVIEDGRTGDVIAVEHLPGKVGKTKMEEVEGVVKNAAALGQSGWTYGGLKKKLGDWKNEEMAKRKEKEADSRKHEPARAYHIGNTIIVEDEDGEVVKTYELPNPTGQGSGDYLKYIGMGRRGTAAEGSADAAKESDAAAPPVKTSVPAWLSKARLGSYSGESSRKKSVVEEQQEADDHHIRFTFGGVGQRMTKDTFIDEMRKLDKKTRKEVVDRSDASHVVKTLAKQDAPDTGLSPVEESHGEDRGKAVDYSPRMRSAARNDGPSEEPSSQSGSSSRSASPMTKPESRGRSTTARQDDPPPGSSSGEPETAVERRRRLAVLQSVGDDEEETNETPAERRRREAALGRADDDSDSDDDNTARVPPARRGIRFADVPGKP